ncbi:MAG: DNA polymerase III subunit chi [Casimicrobium sp.]
MTTIEFYTGVANPISAAHKLALKVFAAKRALRIATPDANATQSLDRLLWEQPEDAFVPHVPLASPLRDATPIILDHEAAHEGACDVLINLCHVPPKYFSRFERLIEIVGRDEDSAKAGRERWQFYKERGYAMTHTDLSKRA